MKLIRLLPLSLLSLLLMAAMPATLHAQQDDKAWFDYMDTYGGPRVGVMGSTLTKLDGDPLIGPAIGGFIEVHITPRIVISFDMNYTHEGTNNAKCSFRSLDGKGPSDISMHMLNSDYRLRYYLTRQFSVATGFHITRILRAYGETDGKSVKIHSDMRRGNLAIPLAAEYNFGPWAVEASYYFTLRKWAGTGDVKSIMGDAVTNKATVTLAYKFQIF